MMPQPNQSTAVPAVSAANRERALEQFYWPRPVLEEGVPLKRLARERGVPLRTAQRWLQRYRVTGLAGLSHQTRADRGRRRRLPTDLQEVIEGLALRKPAPSVASVYRRVCTVAEAHEWLDRAMRRCTASSGPWTLVWSLSRTRGRNATRSNS